MSYQTTVIADGASYYYRLAEPSGTTAADSADANTGTYQGGVTLGQAGLPGTGDSATLLNGTTGYVSSATSLSIPSNTFSCEIWFKSASATDQTLIEFADAQTGHVGANGIDLYLDTVGDLNFRCWVGSAAVASTGGVNYADGLFHHAVAVMAANGNMSLYVDGGAAQASNANVTNVAALTGFWRFGLSDVAGGGPSAGTISEAAIYSTSALSQAQVQAHHDSGVASGIAVLPNADLVTTGWTTPPLFSKVNDANDATLITATLA